MLRLLLSATLSTASLLGLLADLRANDPPLEPLMQSGHIGSIYSVAITADGKRVMTGSDDHSAILWDAESGRGLRQFAGHKGTVWSVAISPDGKQILTGDDDSFHTSANLWDARTGQKVQSVRGHAHAIQAVALSDNGKRFMTGASDRAAILWDSASGDPIQILDGPKKSRAEQRKELEDAGFKLPPPSSLEDLLEGSDFEQRFLPKVRETKVGAGKGHTAPVTGVAISADGRKLPTGSEDGTAILWNAASGIKLCTFAGHAHEVSSVALNSDGSRVLTGSHDRTAALWDAKTGRRIREFIGHTEEIRSVALSRDGKRVLTGADDRMAILWDADTGDKIHIFVGHQESITSVALSGDGTKAVTGSLDGSAILWDTATGKKIRVLNPKVQLEVAAALSDDCRQLLIGAGNKAMIWDADKATFRLLGNHREDIQSVAITPDGKYSLTSAPNELILWKTATGEKICAVQPGLEKHRADSIALSGDGTRFASGGEPVILWDAKTGRKTRAFDVQNGAFCSISLSRNGSKLLHSSDYGPTRLWDANTGKKIGEFGKESENMMAALSRDGQRVVTDGDRGNQIVKWNVQSGRSSTFSPSCRAFSMLAISGDNTKLAFGSSENKVVLCSLEASMEWQKMAGHTSWITSVSISVDGHRILTSSCDRTIRLWDGSVGKELWRLMFFNDGKDWLVLTPEGKFDGTPGGIAMLAYRKPGTLEVIPAKDLLQRYQRRGIMGKWLLEKPEVIIPVQFKSKPAERSPR